MKSSNLVILMLPLMLSMTTASPSGRSSSCNCGNCCVTFNIIWTYQIHLQRERDHIESESWQFLVLFLCFWGLQPKPKAPRAPSNQKCHSKVNDLVMFNNYIIWRKRQIFGETIQMNPYCVHLDEEEIFIVLCDQRGNLPKFWEIFTIYKNSRERARRVARWGKK